MNQDVDKLQESIDSLVRSMGLEPNPPGQQQQSQPQQQQQMPQQGQQFGMGMGMGMGVDNNGGNGNGFDMGNDAFDSNFDVDQFLTELAKSEKQVQDEKKQ